MEPLWGKIDLSGIISNLDWVIVGGESGLCPQPCQIEWIEDILRQCFEADVPVFVKQLGSVLAKTMGLKDRSGGDWMEWPEHIRVRQMPDLRKI